MARITRILTDFEWGSFGMRDKFIRGRTRKDAEFLEKENINPQICMNLHEFLIGGILG